MAMNVTVKINTLEIDLTSNKKDNIDFESLGSIKSVKNIDLIKYEENEFANLYPGTFSYLSQFKRELTERKSDKRSKWFEYGRTQALLDINCEKLLISTIVTEKIFVYNLEKECIPYAGMYISLKKKNKKRHGRLRDFYTSRRSDGNVSIRNRKQKDTGRHIFDPCVRTGSGCKRL